MTLTEAVRRGCPIDMNDEGIAYDPNAPSPDGYGVEFVKASKLDSAIEQALAQMWEDGYNRAREQAVDAVKRLRL